MINIPFLFTEVFMQKFTNNTQIPLATALWLAADEYKYAEYANEISATLLSKSPRYIIASRRLMYPEQFSIPPEHDSVLTKQLLNQENILADIVDQTSIRFGTAVHSAVEKVWLNPELRKQALLNLGYTENTFNRVKVNPKPEDLTPNDIPVYLEQRTYKQINGFVISGQFDFIGDGALQDIKTTSTYSYSSGCNDDYYIKQGSIYRWLNPKLITSDTLTINFVFTDFNKSRIYDEGYPKAKVVGKQFQLLSLTETQMMIEAKLETLHKYWNSPLENIPCCTPQELYSSPPVYKYYAKGFENSTRATRNFNTYAAASAYRAKQGHKGDIIEYRGTPFTCPFCLQHEVDKTLTINKTEENEIEFK